MVKVAVKWNKRVFEDVEVQTSVIQFKAKLQELTVSLKSSIEQHRARRVRFLRTYPHAACPGEGTLIQGFFLVNMYLYKFTIMSS